MTLVLPRNPSIFEEKNRHFDLPRAPENYAHSAPSPTPEVEQLAQHVNKLCEALSNIDMRSDLPLANRTISVRECLDLLQTKAQLLTAQTEGPAAKTTLQAIWETILWLLEPLINLISRIYEVAISTFSTEQTLKYEEVWAIIDELKMRQALSEEQYDRLSKQLNDDKVETALCALTSYLGFSIESILPILRHRSPLFGFTIVHCCYLVSELSRCKELNIILNTQDQKNLCDITLNGVTSIEAMRTHLQTLRSVESRRVLLGWVHALPELLDTQIDQAILNKGIHALQQNNISAFTSSLQPMLSAISTQKLSTEQLYAKELLDFFSQSPSFEKLCVEVEAQAYLSHFTGELSQLKKEAKNANNVIALNSLKRALDSLKKYAGVVRSFAQWKPTCETFHATQKGTIAKMERRIKEIAEQVQTPRPIKSHKHISYLNCSCGGGHKSMTNSLKEALPDAAKHTFDSETIDVPVKVTQSVDPIRKYLNFLGWDSTDLYNYLLNTDQIQLINLLRWINSGEPDPNVQAIKENLIRKAVLEMRPDLLNLIYTFDIEYIAPVAEQLGIPLMHVPTDLDLNCNGWNKKPPKHFATAVHSTHDQFITKNIEPTIPKEQIEEIGLLVGKEFEATYSIETLQKVRKQLGIKPNEKVIVISNGGGGLKNDIPERIAREYKDDSTPVRIIVVTGRNEAFKKYLDESVIPHIPMNAPAQMVALGFQSKKQMAELTHIADVFIGKPGGLTTIELLKAGPRTIFDATNTRFDWEMFNAQVAVNRNRGSILDRKKDLIPLIQKELREKRAEPDDLTGIKASERYTRLASKMIKKAEKDEEIIAIQKGWYHMNKRFQQLVMNV